MGSRPRPLRPGTREQGRPRASGTVAAASWLVGEILDCEGKADAEEQAQKTTSPSSSYSLSSYLSQQEAHNAPLPHQDGDQMVQQAGQAEEEAEAEEAFYDDGEPAARFDRTHQEEDGPTSGKSTVMARTTTRTSTCDI